MRLNRHGVAAVCCKAWGITPAEFWRLCESGEISFQAIASQCYLEILTNPLTAEALFEYLIPGQKREKKKAEHRSDNNRTFEILKAMRERNA